MSKDRIKRFEAHREQGWPITIEQITKISLRMPTMEMELLWPPVSVVTPDVLTVNRIVKDLESRGYVWCKGKFVKK